MSAIKDVTINANLISLCNAMLSGIPWNIPQVTCFLSLPEH